MVKRVDSRRERLRDWKGKNPNRKRGIAITPVKFGISFTTTHLNQAGALVLLYQDGTAQVNHGGTERGQVLYEIALIAARELGLTPDRHSSHGHAHGQGSEHIRDAASCGTDLNALR